MDDARVWAFEESLWTADPQHYAECIDAECLMVLPKPPFTLNGQQAIDAVASTPRWTSVDLAERHVSRPQEGLIVVAYKATASLDGADQYEAHCTSTYRRLSHEHWTVVQHQQTPPLVAAP